MVDDSFFSKHPELFDPDFEWTEDSEIGFVGRYDTKEVLLKKARRCMDLDRRLNEGREIRIGADMSKFRRLRTERAEAYVRLRSFLRDHAGTAITLEDETLHAFLKGVQDGRLPPEGLGKEAELEKPDSTRRFVDLAGGRAADERLERRRLTLPEHPLPGRTAALMSDAWDCWVAGLFTPAVVVCRGVIDHALNDLNAKQPWLDLPKQTKVPQLVDTCPCISNELKRAARSINHLTNGLLHFDEPSDRPDEEGTHRALVATARLLEHLYAARHA